MTISYLYMPTLARLRSRPQIGVTSAFSLAWRKILVDQIVISTPDSQVFYRLQKYDRKQIDMIATATSSRYLQRLALSPSHR